MCSRNSLKLLFIYFEKLKTMLNAFLRKKSYAILENANFGIENAKIATLTVTVFK